MTLLEYYEKGIIKDLYNKGIISINHITYFRYYEVFLAYREKGLSKNKSYDYASDECGCSKRTIQTAVTLITG
jgi:hypothetical protein